MERFADLVGGNSAVLSRQNVESDVASGMIARMDPVVPSLYFEHFSHCNVLAKVDNPAAYLRDWSPKILTDEDWIPKQDLLGSEYYNDFLRRRTSTRSS